MTTIDSENTIENRAGITIKKSLKSSKAEQFTTFEVDGRLYGIDVMKVQEVTRALPMTQVPLAPDYVCGLINLRGQIATAISLRKLFKIPGENPSNQMNVVCRIDGLLFSFLVDAIGDVTEVEEAQQESVPPTVDYSVRRFLESVYKIPGSLLSVVNIDKISEFIHQNDNQNKPKEKA